jgi:hypothetical protein
LFINDTINKFYSSISYCGFEIEMKGIPDKFKKEIETLIWDFIWDEKVNQIKRDVCCLDIENGGMSMVNLDSYIDSRRIKFIYRVYFGRLYYNSQII